MKRRVLLSSVVMAILFLGGLFIAWRAASSEDIWQEISAITPLQIAILLGLSLVNYFLRAFRWAIHGRAYGVAMPTGMSIRHYFGGFGLTLTPGRIGELVRIRWISTELEIRPERAAPLVLADRAADLAAIGVILAVSFAVLPISFKGAWMVTAVCLGLAILLTRPRLLSFCIETLWKPIGKFPRFFARARRAARDMYPFSQATTLAPSLALGLLGWLAEGYALYLLLGWMGVEMSLAVAVLIFLFASVAGGLTAVPGGVGGAEVVMIGLLALQGVPASIAIPATAIIRITTLWFAVIIGLIMFPIAEAVAQKDKNRNALEAV